MPPLPPKDLGKAESARYRLRFADPEICKTFLEAHVDELVEYLLSNLQLDFAGDLSVEKVREFLRDDDGREARRVLAKVIEDNGMDDLLITLVDCLRDNIRTGVSPEVVREQLNLFAEA